MTAFAIVALLLTVAALAFLLPPLLLDRTSTATQPIDSAGASVAVLREQLAELEGEFAGGRIDEELYRAARADLERRVLEDVAHTLDEDALEEAGRIRTDNARGNDARPAIGATRSGAFRPRGVSWSSGVLAVAIPVAAVAMYARLGTPVVLDAGRLASAVAAIEAQRTMGPEQIRAMVEQLAQRLQADPQDAEGWMMLGRSQAVLARYPAAADALGRAAQLRPADVQLLLDYADVLAMANGRRLAGEPKAIVERALRLDPRHPKALALAGSAAFETGDYPTAIRFWESLMAVAPAAGPSRESVQANIEDARRRLGAGRSAPAAQSAASDHTAARPASPGVLRGEVALDEALAARARPEDTVFVYARAAQGPRMPLAIARRSARELPFRFTLDDSTSMNPASPLSRAGDVVVVARVSRSGSPAPQPGDLEGSSGPVAVVNAGDIGVRIDREIR